MGGLRISELGFWDQGLERQRLITKGLGTRFSSLGFEFCCFVQWPIV